MSTSRTLPAPPERPGGEELDQALAVTRLRWWIPLLGAGAICIGALVWSIWGRVPISVNGYGVLIDPGAVKNVEATAAGVVAEVLVEPGQRVEAGALLVRLERPALEHAVQQAREALAAVSASNNPMLEANRRRFEAEIAAFDREQALLRESRRLAESLHTSTERQLAAIRELIERSFATRENLLAAESAAIDSQGRVVGLDLRTQEVEAQRAHAVLQNGQTEFTLRNQIDEARRTLEKLELQLEQERSIRAPVGGRVLETMVTVGRAVTFGTAVATLGTSDRHDALRVLCYFPVKEGKQIAPGMRMLVTPSTVKRERYGGMIGRVSHVSTFPVSREAAVNRIGSDELAHSLTSAGPVIEVDALLEPARAPGTGSDYQWSSKPPPVPVTQGTVTLNRVTVEERAPITYLMPLLHTWFLGRKDDEAPAR